MSKELISLSELEKLGKKEIQQLATDQMNLILSEGNENPLQTYVRLKKVVEYCNSAIDKMKDSAQTEGMKFNRQTAYGAKVEMRNTGDKLDYSSDPIYAELERKLKDRKELLTMSHKSYASTIFDENGVEVPKVGVKTNGVESLFISF